MGPWTQPVTLAAAYALGAVSARLRLGTCVTVVAPRLGVLVATACISVFMDRKQ